MAHDYVTSVDEGKGFITHVDREFAGLDFAALPGGIWRVAGSQLARDIWRARVGGTKRTVAEAQAIVDAAIAADGLRDAKGAPLKVALT